MRAMGCQLAYAALRGSGACRQHQLADVLPWHISTCSLTCMDPDCTSEQAYDVTPFVVEGVVLEVLAGFGIAHIRCADGAIYGITRKLAGESSVNSLKARRFDCWRSGSSIGF
jgi:hypothetical protein